MKKQIKIALSLSLMLALGIMLLMLTGCFERCHHTGTTTVTRENEIEYTCTEMGSYEEVVVCNDCGKEIARTEKVTAAAHRLNPPVQENVTSPNCVSTGFCETVEYCSVCSAEVSRKPTVLPATGQHRVQYGSCPDCGIRESTQGLKFTLNPDGNTYSAAGMGFCEDVNIIIGIYNNRSVTSVAPNSFSYDPKIESVIIDECVTTIGASAFEYCDLLTTVDIPSSVMVIDFFAFRHCHSLVNATIGDNVTEIGMAAFARCTSLKSIHLGESVISIGDDAFYECTSLTEILVDVDNENYKTVDGDLYTKDGKVLVQYALGKAAKEFTVPTFVETVAPSAFYKSSHLNSLTIPDNVTTIGKGAFMNCAALESVALPATITEIGEEMFRDCIALETVAIPETVTAIAPQAFRNCISLKSITIPEGVTSIGDNAFYYCLSLTSIVIPNNVTSIGKEAFLYCMNLSKITLGSSLSSIGIFAFFSCEKLLEVYNLSSLQLTLDSSDNGYVSKYAKVINTSLDTPSRIVSKDGYTFYLDSQAGEYWLLSFTGNMTNPLRLPETVDGNNYNIYKNAFRENENLRRIYIPDGTKIIGTNAFYGCTKLSAVAFGESLELIEKGAFAGCAALNFAMFDVKDGWWTSSDPLATSGTAVTEETMASTSLTANAIKDTTVTQYWKRTATPPVTE